jgi:hypothetical protein
VTVLALSLIDQRTGAHQSITLSPRGDFRRIHSGDVKIYERLGAPGRAWLVHGVRPVAGAAAAQAALRDPAFDPRSEAATESGQAPAPPRAAGPEERVTVDSYEAERATYSVTASSPGLLVVADAWYPGWRARVDGLPVDVVRANLLYRAVPLEAGQHRVTFEYAPDAWRTGVSISLGTGGLLLVALAAALFIRLRALLI